MLKKPILLISIIIATNLVFKNVIIITLVSDY